MCLSAAAATRCWSCLISAYPGFASPRRSKRPQQLSLAGYEGNLPASTVLSSSLKGITESSFLIPAGAVACDQGWTLHTSCTRRRESLTPSHLAEAARCILAWKGAEDLAAKARILALLATSSVCCMANEPAQGRLKSWLEHVRKLLRKRASCKFLIASIYARHVGG